MLHAACCPGVTCAAGQLSCAGWQSDWDVAAPELQLICTQQPAPVSVGRSVPRMGAVAAQAFPFQSYRFPRASRSWSVSARYCHRLVSWFHGV